MVAYVLAAVCLLVPFAVVGAVFAGAVLMRRNRPHEGMGVIATALVAMALGLLLVR